MSNISAGWRWWAFGFYFLAWTAALLLPVPGAAHDAIGLSRREIVAKGLHVAAYVVFAMLGGWLRAPVRYRFLVMFFLMGHAMLTEVLQNALNTGRSGELRDVALDHLGITIGMVLTWRWWVKIG